MENISKSKYFHIMVSYEILLKINFFSNQYLESVSAMKMQRSIKDFIFLKI